MRRRELVLGTAGLLLVRAALAQDRVPQGVSRVRGGATVNGQPAKQGMVVRAGDKVATGADAEIVFVLDRDAMLLRRNGSLEVAKSGFRLVTGAILSVFAPKQRRELRTPTATIGIRGTAVYLEAEASRTYVCTCYGEAVLEPVDEPAARETVRTRHHEQPRYIMARGAPRMVAPAPVLNHSDAELEMLEALVGRQPPFAGQPGPRY
ncbi:MAG TPA: hypothetical protein VFB53_02050 [Burkholderiales bacterium]|nr:hypothetical protein [Burkholderiales bacterium]